MSRPAPSKFAGRRIHLTGIGGTGMSGLARVLLDAGAAVTGTDPTANAQTAALSAAGVEIRRCQDGSLVGPGLDLLVHTAAVHEDNEDVRTARKHGRRVAVYAEILGEVMAERLGVAVAGTHGKSTTSAMLAHALLTCGADPSFVIGGTVPQLGGGSRSGGGRAFVAEACEFNRSFHRLHPTVAVITNVEEDHLDYYRDLAEIVEAFRIFAAEIRPGGAVIVNADDANTRRAVDGLPAVQTVGESAGCDWKLENVRLEDGRFVCDVVRAGRPPVSLRPALPGRHNLSNAAIALAAAVFCGLGAAEAAAALATFHGVDRRMTEIGTVGGATVVDDYGHHPTEVRATLAALRQRYRPRRLTCVFQPHQHSRTRDLMDAFAASFADADAVVLPPIYAARDSDDDKRAVTSEILAAKINAVGPEKAVALPTFDAVAEHLREMLAEGDLIVTMGAGDVWKVAASIVARAPRPRGIK